VKKPTATATGQHTPGPWIAKGWENLCVNAFDPIAGECTLSLAAGRRDASLEELRANAALIAAAPELLSALKKWATFARDNYTDEDIPWLDEMRAAIAKAEGRA